MNTYNVTKVENMTVSFCTISVAIFVYFQQIAEKAEKYGSNLLR